MRVAVAIELLRRMPMDDELMIFDVDTDTDLTIVNIENDDGPVIKAVSA